MQLLSWPLKETIGHAGQLCKTPVQADGCSAYRKQFSQPKCLWRVYTSFNAPTFSVTVTVFEWLLAGRTTAGSSTTARLAVLGTRFLRFACQLQQWQQQAAELCPSFLDIHATDPHQSYSHSPFRPFEGVQAAPERGFGWLAPLQSLLHFQPA
jgi:hypothetical protein